MQKLSGDDIFNKCEKKYWKKNYRKKTFCIDSISKLEARGKPSTWLPREGLVEHFE